MISQSWVKHFEFIGPIIAGKTPRGRATVRNLAMNSDVRVDLR